MSNIIKKAITYLNDLGINKNISDEEFLRKKYYKFFNKNLDLQKPQTFNEKLQWLKINDRREIYNTMVDKYEAKKYVSSLIGEEYIIPTIGIYNSFNEIDFDKLPNQFVIKCTHDSGGVTICRNKKEFNIRKAKRRFNAIMKRNYYYRNREWPYKDLKPRIIIEKYMDNKGEELEDYKVHNFNGIPKVILVCKDRHKKTGLTEDFFDTEWNHLDIKRPNHENSKEIIEKPKQLEEIVMLSKKLSENIPFVRTDFYIINNKIYFGELTLYPAGGFIPFIPDDWDYKLGDYLNINKI